MEAVPETETAEGSKIYWINPETTAEYGGCVGRFLLYPGEELKISVPHGVTIKREVSFRTDDVEAVGVP